MENDKLVRLSDAVDEIESLLDVYNEDEGNIVLRHAVKCVKRIPAVDAVEVVRCRECIVPHNEKTGCPKLLGVVTMPDFFCGFGNRGDSRDK